MLMGHNVYDIWTKFWLMVPKKKFKVIIIFQHDLKL